MPVTNHNLAYLAANARPAIYLVREHSRCFILADRSTSVRRIAPGSEGAPQRRVSKVWIICAD